ncbi:MAG: UDP-N-acetylmuramate:L-alanyl-gamma-D-glutamyl-meso-diaminopimelate ligase, partial [Bdellovibrionales bacterium]|nr:UDP-N-acetylmuramate:L-alanyl-gamma-D-glutamyl-meso-diaminopimelate ligase [Bdellovibrionales bacterium]
MSDQLKSLGIEIKQGYVKENLIPRPDLVIVGNVIRKSYEEAEALLESDIPYTSLPKAIGEFVIQDRNSVVLTGTHGKTTMTTLMSWIAQSCELNPGFLIGGVPLNFDRSFQIPKGDWWVIEGDEYDTAFFDKVPKFIHYRPKYVVISSIEFDHADIYNDIHEIKSVFRKLVELIPEDGVLVAHGSDENVLEVIQGARCKVVTYGEKECDYTFEDRQSINGRNNFTVVKNQERVADIAVKQFGLHNTLNVLACYALSREMGWSESAILNALASFKGVKRRQEHIGELNGSPLIEDFAHHPTAVELTIEAMREAYPDRRICAVFEPRSNTSRRKIFQREYVQALEGADWSLIKTPFDQSRIARSDRLSVEEIVEEINLHGGKSQSFESTEEIVKTLKESITPRDVVLIMSNGGFDGIYDQLKGKVL